MRDLTIVFPHFMNLGMLAEQFRIWADYPESLRRRLHVVVVDDCSPKAQRPHRTMIGAIDIASLRIYRLTQKKRWNWLACRNLGAKVATTDWMLLTDIDHAVPAETLERIVNGELDPGNVYRFKRVTATRVWPYALSSCTDYKTHNDSWLMTRTLFFSDAVGGYDERLSGCYGTSGEFKDRLFAAARAHVVLHEPLIRYPREIIADASTSPDVYTRKGDPANDALLAKLKAERAKIKDWRPLHGLVPYDEIYSTMECVA